MRWNRSRETYPEHLRYSCHVAIIQYACMSYVRRISLGYKLLIGKDRTGHGKDGTGDSLTAQL